MHLIAQVEQESHRWRLFRVSPVLWPVSRRKILNYIDASWIEKRPKDIERREYVFLIVRTIVNDDIEWP